MSKIKVIFALLTVILIIIIGGCKAYAPEVPDFDATETPAAEITPIPQDTSAPEETQTIEEAPALEENQASDEASIQSDEQSKQFDSKNAPLDGGNSFRAAVAPDEAGETADVPFNSDDLYVQTADENRMSMASSMEDVINLFGEPLNMDELNALQADAKEARLEYSFAQVDIVLNERPQTVSSITLRDDTLRGPRGIKVGDSMDAVLAAFPITESDEIEYEVQYLYRGNEQYPDLPSRGRILYDDAGEIPVFVMYEFPITPYTFDEPEEYIYQSHAALSYTIADGVVISINISVGPYASN